MLEVNPQVVNSVSVLPEGVLLLLFAPLVGYAVTEVPTPARQLSGSPLQPPDLSSVGLTLAMPLFGCSHICYCRT